MDPKQAKPARVGPTTLLASGEEPFRLLVESVQDYAIFMLDPDGYVVSWNSGAQKIKGYRADEIIGRHFSAFYPAEAVNSGWPAEELRRAVANGHFEEENWRVRKDGTLFWANVVLTAIHDATGMLCGFAKVTRDMTERKRLEELESSSQRMNQFLATLAHELRNPLAPIRNAVSVMQMEPLVSPTLKNCRSIIDRQLTQLTRLVDDLLDVSRISTGKISMKLEPLDLRDVVERAVEATRSQLDARQQKMEVALPRSPVMVSGDLTRLTQVLQNLLQNAAKFTPRGGRVAISIQGDHDSAVVQVRDNGRGMSEKATKDVFNLFVQGENPENPHEAGLGLGLTISRSIAELHGGAIRAYSPGAGKGSTFSVLLPRLARGVITEAEDQPDGSLRVLIADDNRDSADSMAMLVTLLGHQVRTVYDGMAAVTVACDYHPDLVLLDLAMPGLTGFEVLARLRVMPEPRPRFVAAMTGFGNADDLARTRDAGFNDHLTKPVSAADFARILQRLAH